jgi:hypothetical protein
VNPKATFFNWTIKPAPGDEILHYEYSGPADLLGKVVKREPAGKDPS